MTTSALAAFIPIVFTIGALGAMFFILKLRRDRDRLARARLAPEGFQEQEIVVKGRYQPDVVVVRRGIPVLLYFRREEDTHCSERVIFSDFHVGSRLAAHETTSICFLPTRVGEFLFTCEFGLYQGRLVVVEPSRRDMEKIRGVGPGNSKDRLPHPASGRYSSLGLVSGPMDRGRKKIDDV